MSDGLDREELEAQRAEALPDREAMSLISGGGLLGGAGMGDAMGGDGSGGLLGDGAGGDTAAGGGDPASAADSYGQQADPATDAAGDASQAAQAEGSESGGEPSVTDQDRTETVSQSDSASAG